MRKNVGPEASIGGFKKLKKYGSLPLLIHKTLYGISKRNIHYVQKMWSLSSVRIAFHVFGVK